MGLRELRKLQRWDLTTQTLELTTAAPDGGVTQMAASPCTAGPLLMTGDRGSADHKMSWMINTSNFHAEPLPSHHWNGNGGGAWGPGAFYVSFDGSTAIAAGGGWAGVELYRIVGGKIVDIVDGNYYAQGDISTAGNGSLVFRGGGIHRSDLVTEVKGIEGECFPALDPTFSLAYAHGRGKHGAELVVFANGDPKPLITLRDVPELAKNAKLPPSQRIFLIPAAKCLITLGEGGDKLVLRPFDLSKELDDEGVDYLFVESGPPSSANLGIHFTGKIAVRSKKGGVKMELQSAPKGMTINKDGVINWQVPRHLDDKTPTVIVAISDGSNQTAFYSFTVNCGEATNKR